MKTILINPKVIKELNLKNNKIKKTDNEIDELVYQLYGITEEEKKIIEETLK